MNFQEFINKITLADVISFFAIIISIVTISWIIYKDILLKPRLKGRIQISNIHQRNRTIGPFADITFVNHGPGHIIVESIWVHKKSLWRWLFRKLRWAFVMHDYTNPLSSNLPRKLEVGEKITLLFKCENKLFLATEPTHIGLKDSFGKIHWVNKKSLKIATKEYLKDHPKEEFGEIKNEETDI